MTTRFAYSLIIGSALQLVACSDDDANPVATPGDTGADVSAQNDTSPADSVVDAPADAAEDALPTNFASVYNTLNVICVDCHRPDEGPEGALDLSSQSTAYAQLVGVAAAGRACGGASRTRVVAGDPTASLLFQKISGSPPCGDKMPPGPSPLDAKYVEQIRAWIAAGAKND